jgi:peptidoglycan DL-endopeptidase CwlO
MTGRRFAILSLIFVTLLALAASLQLPSVASADTLAQKRAEARRIMVELQALDAKMEIAVENYNIAASKLAAANQNIADNQHDLAVAKYNLDIANETLQQRVVAMYKRQPVEILDVLLSTQSFEDLVSQLDLFNRVSQNDVDVISSIDDYKADVVAAQDSLQTERVAAQKLVAECAAQKQQIESSLAQRRTMLSGVKDQIAEIERQQAAAAEHKATQDGLLPVPGGGGGDPGPGHGGVVGIAMQYIGVPYVYGGASPSTGFDCSGFTMYVYGQVGISLPHAASQQYAMCTPVERSQLQPGDLVFFGSPIHHVGLYVGGGMMIHAPHTGSSVRVEALSSDYSCGGRP